MQKKIYNLLKLIIILLIFFYIGPLLGLIFIKIGFDISTFTYVDSAYAEVLLSIILSIILFVFYRKKLIEDYRNFKINLKENLKKSFMLFGILLFVKLTASVSTSILCSVFNIEFLQSDNQNIVESLIGSAPMMMFISSVLLAPFVEEVIFRLGFKEVISSKKAYILTSGIVFGFIHIFPTDLNIVIALSQSIIYVSIGIVLAWMYEKENNIYFVIVAHALNNLLGLLAALILL